MSHKSDNGLITLMLMDHHLKDEATLLFNSPPWSVYHYLNSLITNHTYTDDNKFSLEIQVHVAAVPGINDLPNLKKPQCPGGLTHKDMLTWKNQTQGKEYVSAPNNITGHVCCPSSPPLSHSLQAILAPWCLRGVLSVWQVKFSLLM